MDVTPLTAVFAAKITGIDLSTSVTEATFAPLRAAFEQHSVLIIPGQPMDDAAQIAFSEHFGPLERTISANPAGGTPFARQSNIDVSTGALIPPEDRRMDYQRGNMRWHADSTFKQTPSLCSVLTARKVPPSGGATEFASTPGRFWGFAFSASGGTGWPHRGTRSNRFSAPSWI